MNKYQKLVQQKFLNDEDVIIARLEKVYNQSANDILKNISVLDSSIGQLQQAYSDIGADGIGDIAAAVLGSKNKFTPEEVKETLQSMIQSKVYQKKYQEAMKKQIDGVLDKMQVDQYSTVSEYLEKCYENGYVGTMYDLMGQGIPMCIPLDQEAMVTAVQLDSKISQGLYNKLGVDVNMLKGRIAANVSRGISSGMNFQQVAQQLTGSMKIGYNNAIRIVRTEGHRIQVQSAMNACQDAKDMGADVVKQWDSTLDGRTRPSHQIVDGEIRELDEPFSNGLMFPGDPAGGAGEVVNCRCALLQRARWALDDDELETLKERADFFGLDKTANFDEFKDKYLSAAAQQQAQPKKTYLTKKKLETLVKDGNTQLDDLNQKFKNASGGLTYDEILAQYGTVGNFAASGNYDMKLLKSLKTQMDDVQSNVDDWSEKLFAKEVAQKKKKLVGQEKDIKNQLNDLESNLNTYSFPGNSGKWSNVSAKDYENLKNDIDKKIKYFEKQILNSNDLNEMQKYQGYVKQLKEIETDGIKLADLKSELLKVKTQIANVGKKPANFTKNPIDDIISNAKKFGTDKDAIAYHTANNYSDNLWRNVFTSDDREGIKRYTGSFYRQMNRDLRSGKYKTSSVQWDIDNCTSALSKASVADDVLVYRGMGTQSSVARFLGVPESSLVNDSVRNALVGTRVTEKGFLSTAIVPGRAWSGCKLDIYLPKGTKAMYVDPVSTYSGEQEMLIQRNSTFEIKEFETDSSGNVTKIVMVLVDQTL